MSADRPSPVFVTNPPFFHYLAPLGAKYMEKRPKKNSKKSMDFCLFGAFPIGNAAVTAAGNCYWFLDLWTCTCFSPRAEPNLATQDLQVHSFYRKSKKMYFFAFFAYFWVNFDQIWVFIAWIPMGKAQLSSRDQVDC